jgi:uncharacterized protein
MRQGLAILAVLVAVLVIAPLAPAAALEFPVLSGRVVDAAGVLNTATREALRAKLAAHEASTTNQIVVATVRSLDGNSIESYANRLFRHWQLGQRGKNNGVLLLHAPNERKLRIEVGYGLESRLTSAIARSIIENTITPRFRSNDFAGGMTRGVDDIIKVLSGNAAALQRSDEPRRRDWDISGGMPILLGIVLFIIANSLSGLLGMIHALLVSAGLAQKNPTSGFWHWALNRSSHGGSSDTWSSSDSSWSSSDSGSSDSFSGGGGDSGGGGWSGDY